MLAARPWAAEILYVWFHLLGPEDWFRGGPHIDRLLKHRFAREWQALHRRPAQEFLTDPQTARAAVLLFDQLPRNVFRDDPRSFASDRLAMAIARGALDRGWDKGLTLAGRQFLAMPLMHSEQIADQRRSLREFAAMGSSFLLSFARSHHRMVARFGRFPHRNAVLGRRSTPQEKAAVDAGNAW